MALRGRITINDNLCKSCELCISVCPEEAIRISDGINYKGYHPAEFIKDMCRGCALCSIVCPEIAIEVYRER
ncbi:MAG: 4Fe-4S binding protein [Deltaproteobacteria bacterium]|nr:4Fe-4S binding protein [Deltaproteobacteria bacterium]